MQALLQYRALGIEVRNELDGQLSKTPGQFLHGNSLSSGQELSQRDARPASDFEESPSPEQTQPDLNSNSTVATRWSLGKRLRTFVTLWLLVFALGWTSVADSTVLAQAASCFHISEVTETLATALFLAGIATGSLVAGPISETVGRTSVYLSTCTVFLGCLIASGASPNLPVQLVFRALGGLFSSATLSIYGGTLADILTVEERKWAWPIFALSPVLGPVLSPVAGGWIAGRIPWRWVYWISLILSAFAFTLAVLFLPETYSGTLQYWKTKHFRRFNENDKFLAPIEEGMSLKKRILTSLRVPFSLFHRELIVQLLGAYLTLIYVIIFTFLNGFSFVFGNTYGFSTGKSSLAFIGVAIGNVIGTLAVILYYYLHSRGITLFRKSEDDPEYHLVPAMISAPFLAISLLVMGWTNYTFISPWVGLASTVVFGFAMNAVFISSYQYIIMSYGPASSTALASITTARYYISAGMIVASRPMYIGLGVHWTLTLLGGLATLLVPAPFVLYRWGESIRGKSKVISNTL